MLYFPRPYPDEVIGSLVTRACRHAGLSVKALAWLIYGKQRSYSSFLLVSSVRPLARVTGLDPEALLWDHTVFPYVVAFMPDAEASRLQAMVMSPMEEHVGRIGSCTQSVTQGAACRRYCRSCAVVDEQKHGESYWHRLHQLPAVYVCPIHGEPLLETAFRIRGLMRKWQYALPSETPGRSVASKLQLSLLCSLASASAQLLSGDRRPQGAWAAHYRTLAFEAGYARAGEFLAGRRLAQDLAVYYGTALLKDTGCALTTNTLNYWPALMVREGAVGSFAPIKHLLLQTFLERNKAKEPELGYRAPGPQRRDRSALDRELAARVRRQLARIRRGQKRLTVTELMTRVGGWQVYRHERQSFPVTAMLVREFRRSQWSARRMHAQA